MLCEPDIDVLSDSDVLVESDVLNDVDVLVDTDSESLIDVSRICLVTLKYSMN